jgi:hypothetical protein
MIRFRRKTGDVQPLHVPLDDTIDGGLPTRQAIPPSERACCCAAPAVVRVVVSYADPVAHSVDLLLCGHHYRSSVAELARRGAMVFDHEGNLICRGTPAAQVNLASVQVCNAVSTK